MTPPSHRAQVVAPALVFYVHILLILDKDFLLRVTCLSPSAGIKTELIFWQEIMETNTFLLPLNERINKQINNGIPVSLVGLLCYYY